MNDACYLYVDDLGDNISGSGVSAMVSSNHPKRHPTIVALTDDHDLVELLLKTCMRPWKVTVAGDFPTYLNIASNGECKVVVVDDEKLVEADRGWLLNKLQNWMPQAFIVYVASHHSPDVEKLARSRGAGYYLSKPVDNDRLINLLSALQRMNGG